MKSIETRITYWLNADAQANGIPPGDREDYMRAMSRTLGAEVLRLQLQSDDMARDGGLIGKVIAYSLLGWRSRDAHIRAQMTGSDEGQR